MMTQQLTEEIPFVVSRKFIKATSSTQFIAKRQYLIAKNYC